MSTISDDEAMKLAMACRSALDSLVSTINSAREKGVTCNFQLLPDETGAMRVQRFECAKAFIVPMAPQHGRRQ